MDKDASWFLVRQCRRTVFVRRASPASSFTVGAQNARTRCAFDRHAPMHVEQTTAIRRRSYEAQGHESRHSCPINEHLAWDWFKKQAWHIDCMAYDD
jgi:hypothetical protein